MEQRGCKRGDHGRPHFLLLDGLRGVAAIGVACYHLPEVFGGRQRVPHGALAVDFFFMLSGFVFACAYERRLRDGDLSSARLIGARLIRLLPMAWMGLALGAGSFIVGGAVRAHGAAPFIGHVALGAALLPDLAPNPYGDNVLPLNWPSWSLFFELYGGTAFALVAPRLSSRTLSVAVALLALIYAGSAVATGNANVGLTPWTLGAGLARFGYAFLLGWLFWRLRVHLAAPRVPAAVIAFMLVAVLIVPAPAPWQVGFDLAAAMIVCPAVLALGSACRSGLWSGQAASTWAGRMSDGLGRMSYPLYAVHAPVYLLVGHYLGDAAGLMVGACAALAIAAAALLWYDEPLRRRLAKPA